MMKRLTCILAKHIKPTSSRGVGSGCQLFASCLFACLMLASCIDEDLSRCGVNYSVEYVVRQDMHAVLQDEIDRELMSPAEQLVGARLDEELSGVYSDIAHDLDLSFFDNHQLSLHQNVIVDASSARLTVYMQRADYRNLALANLAQEPTVTLDGASSDAGMAVNNLPADTIDSHVTGLFSARMDMAVDNTDQTFRADLYMLNSTAVIAINDQGLTPADVKAYVCDMAAGFAVNDSTYSFDRSPVVRTRSFTESGHHCLYATAMPSRDHSPDGNLWRMKVYVTMGGKVTESILTVGEPLRAGDVKIIKAKLNPDGSISTDEPEVGVSVTLDWKPGGSHDVEM